MKTWIELLGVGCILFMVPGCGTYQTQHAIPTASRAMPDWGTLKVYSTDNVPFEYEELGFVTYSAFSRTHPIMEEDALARFRDKVIRMGADAVLDFRYSCNRLDYGIEVSGVAVKIKKP